MRDYVCERIPWSEYLAWEALTGTIVRASEYATLVAMDRAFCAEMNKELFDYQARLADKRENARKPGKYRSKG